jgi:hypothetical protein
MPGWALAIAFTQTAAHDRCREFTREAIVKWGQFPNWHQIESGQAEGACFDQPFEPADGHLIQPTLHFAETCGSIRLKRRSPAYESLFAEQKMRPRKN